MANNPTTGLTGISSLLHLPSVTRIFWALYRDRRVPLWLKVAAVGGLVYIFSPLDIIPDAITGIGLLDDFIVSLIMMQTFIDLAPREVMLEHCQRLKIDPGKLNVNVAKALAQALNLAALFVENRRKFQQPAPPQAAASNGQAVAAAAGAENAPGEEPRYKRYSAFQEEPDRS